MPARNDITIEGASPITQFITSSAITQRRPPRGSTRSVSAGWRPASTVHLGLVLLLGASVSGLSGCVSTGKYETLEQERDELARERLQLQREVDDLTQSQQQLAQEVERKSQQLAELTLVQERLAGELETEVAMRQVDVTRLADGIRLNVSDQLLFPSGSATLDAKGLEVLGRIASQLDPERQIISVVGHADSRMLPERMRAEYPTNWELAGARAAIVVRVLSEAGIPPTSLRAVSRGPFDPVASNDTVEGRTLNRRTEIIVRQDPRSE